jgi:peroxiredoxin
MEKRKRNNFHPLFIVLGAVLLLAGLALVINYRQPEADREGNAAVGMIPAEMNKPAPQLALVDLSGDAVSLDDYAGQVVFVNHWATWCPPCRAEMPELEAYYRAHREEGFTLVAINAGESADDVRPFVEELDLSFPVWVDPQGEAMRAFGVNGLPTSFVIDGSGTIVQAWPGAVTLEQLEEHVTPLLKQ